MGEQVKNLLIGIFVIVGCGIAVFFVMFLKPSVGNGEKTLVVYFSDINKVPVGTRVLYAGKPVGEVVKIEEIPNARSEPTDALGRLYFYKLILKVDSSVQVYDTDQIAVETSGLLGEKSVAIIPKAPPKGVTPHLIGDQPIYANSTDPIELAVSKISDLATEMEGTFHEITTWFHENSGNLSNAVQTAGEMMCELKRTMQTINDENLIEEVKKGTVNFSNLMSSANDVICQLQSDKVFDNMGPMMVNLKNASHSIDLITNDIANGCGTIGRLIKSDDLYLRVNSLLSKADTMMNDINHYGLLFHLNKSWQRMRTKRASILDSLDSPSSFSTFFESEIDEINTAMARISMLLDKAKENPKSQQIMQSEPFKKDFADLLREVEELSDNLKLYNEQLMGSDDDYQERCN